MADVVRTVAADHESESKPYFINPAFEHDDSSKNWNSPNRHRSTTTTANGVKKVDAEKNQSQPVRTKRNVYKNLIAISLGFLCLFTAYGSLANIQSSLNPYEGLGSASLSTTYGALVVSCMFVPSLMMKKLGVKWTISVSMLLYTTYMAANFYAQWYTLIPASIILGIGAAPLWSAKCTYLTQIGSELADIVGEQSEVIIVRFFGIFFMTFQSNQVIGNLISSIILSPEGNTTISPSDEQLAICGSPYCNEAFPYGLNTSGNSSEPISGKPADSQIYVLCGIYVAFSVVAAIVIAIFVDRLDRPDDTEKSTFSLLVATFTHMKNPKQLLLIPLTIYSGIEQAFMTSDFTKSFITCPLGIHMVGYVMICYGLVDAICSVAFGPVVKKFGRLPLYILGAAINVAMAITMLNWQPHPDKLVILFVMAGLWGMADAIWQTQINAFYGVVFSSNEEAAFSNYRLWESLGFIIAFAYSNYLCVYVKLYILLAILAAGMAGYVAVEVLLRSKSTKESYSLKG